MERNQFSIKKMKIRNEGGLDVTYEVMEYNGAEIYYNDYKVQSSKEPHPDMLEPLKHMAPMIADVFYLPKDKRSMLRVRGISIGGSSESSGAVISGELVASNQLNRMSINTYLIRFDTDNYQWEEELRIHVQKIEDEVFAYLFENKQAQMEIID